MKVKVTYADRFMATMLTLVGFVCFLVVMLVFYHFLLDFPFSKQLPNINNIPQIDLCGDIIKKCNRTHIPTILKMRPYKIIINICLIAIFWAQHMIMSDLTFKKTMIKLMPKYIFIERAMYNLASEACLIFVFTFWQNLMISIFEFPQESIFFLEGIKIFGLFFVIKAGFDLRYIEIYQLWSSDYIDFEQRYEPKDQKIVETNVYKLCRHPQQLGIILILLSAGRVWNVDRILVTQLLIIGIYFGCRKEEKQNCKLHESYREYSKRVTNMFIPNPLNLFKKNKNEVNETKKNS